MLLFLFILTAVTYSPALKNSFVWDDINNIVRNKSLQGPIELKNIFLKPFAGFYRPLSYLTIVLDYKIWGRNPAGYHLTNLLFHILNVMILFLLTAKVFGSLRPAFIAALLFALHPVQTEAVSYISGRSDLIAAFFILASFYCIIQGAGNFYAIAFFIAALFARENVLLYPLVLGACIEGPVSGKVKKVLPYFAAALFFIIFRVVVVGKIGVLPSWGSPLEIFRYFIFYCKMIIFPWNLHMQHSLSESAIIDKMPFLLSAFLSGVIIYGLFKLAPRQKLKFALKWFLIFLLPFIGILSLNSQSQLAEHWLYLPSAGIFIVIAAALAKFKNPVFFPISTVIVIVLMVLTFRQNGIWHDDLNFYRYTLKFHPQSVKIRYNLGNAYLRRNMLDRAGREYRAVLKISPDYSYALNNMGLVMEKRGLYKKAFKYYEEAFNNDRKLVQAAENKARVLKIIGQ